MVFHWYRLQKREPATLKLLVSTMMMTMFVMVAALHNF